MFRIVNERTGVVVGRSHDMLTAQRRASELTEAHAWVFGDKFEVQVVA